MTKGSAIKYTQEQLDFIQFNCSMDRKSLAEKVNTILVPLILQIKLNHFALEKSGIPAEQGIFKKEVLLQIRVRKDLLQQTKQVLKKVRLPGIKSLLDMNVFVQKMGMS